jgi:hypothetical protein
MDGKWTGIGDGSSPISLPPTTTLYCFTECCPMLLYAQDDHFPSLYINFEEIKGKASL